MPGERWAGSPGIGRWDSFRPARSPRSATGLAELAVAETEHWRAVNHNVTRETTASDERTRDAVIRNIEIIGEAAGKLPDEVTARAPQIPWRLICDMRNVLAHAYFGVSLKVVWDTATTQIDELEKAVRALLE